jgi:RHS repeat-associated protein
MTQYYHFDGLGSTDRITNSSGIVVVNYAYYAFGATKSSAGSTTNSFRFVGRPGYYLNPDLASYYLRARHYDPAAGRFLSVDPMALEDVNTNVYIYVQNSPVNYNDPTGLFPPRTPPRIDRQRIRARASYYEGPGELFIAPSTTNELSPFAQSVIFGSLEQLYKRSREKAIIAESRLGTSLPEISSNVLGLDLIPFGFSVDTYEVTVADVYSVLGTVLWQKARAELRLSPIGQSLEQIIGSVENNRVIKSIGLLSAAYGTLFIAERLPATPFSQVGRISLGKVGILHFTNDYSPIDIGPLNLPRLRSDFQLSTRPTFDFQHPEQGVLTPIEASLIFKPSPTTRVFTGSFEVNITGTCPIGGLSTSGPSFNRLNFHRDIGAFITIRRDW